MKRCLGPCVAGLCTKEEYDRAVEDVKLLLSGKTDELIRLLEAADGGGFGRYAL